MLTPQDGRPRGHRHGARGGHPVTCVLLPCHLHTCPPSEHLLCIVGSPGTQPHSQHPSPELPPLHTGREGAELLLIRLNRLSSWFCWRLSRSLPPCPLLGSAGPPPCASVLVSMRSWLLVTGPKSKIRTMNGDTCIFSKWEFISHHRIIQLQSPELSCSSIIENRTSELIRKD